MFEKQIQRAGQFAAERRVANTWQFATSASARPTVYASCFAAMVWRYSGQMEQRTSAADRAAWADYLNSFQDPDTGEYPVPEIDEKELLSKGHDREHLLMHFLAHMLPALDALGARPRHALKFMDRFIDPDGLDEWLRARDWRRAWIEGNNLLFIGQFLIHVGEIEGRPEALKALERLMAWLDQEVDPRTGLWGSNGSCTLYEALYGGYHQLLLYYYLRRPVHAKELVRSVLSLQHFDGGFHEYRGGGTCHDVDAIDVLVNMYKRHDFERRAIRRSLRRAAAEVLGRQTSSGGFVDRKDTEFCHMGIAATRAPIGEPNLFSTWFGTHTLLLIDEVLGSPERNPVARRAQHFNRVCSMGWHDVTLLPVARGGFTEALVDGVESFARRSVVAAYEVRDKLRGAPPGQSMISTGH